MNNNPGQGTSSKGIFSTPMGLATEGSGPVNSDGSAKTFDYGNATDGFETPKYSEGGMGVINGPGTATGSK
jgi:hypothetical protein